MTDLDRLYRAWYDEGINPRYHRMMKNMLRQKWPVLFYTIESLLRENRKEHNESSK